ncbi:MAG: DUF1801 domain-containing protein [Jannaschia helgolandensis]|uniref:YdhG-like domain-containing protein n=1 Tax=Jannaschia helgolandensis TaxID=188906 RepID=A0A1H7G1M9_9RHOB|nr:DUF1801 domain-containing protein [Jannaschia helgolandensis]SEK30360.1 protein of unknown function (DU1801) [Jannaschia helgolandensis]
MMAIPVDPPFQTDAVAQVFGAFPDAACVDLLRLRALIFATAAEIPDLGPLTETLKWGQPAYLPAAPRIGTAVRLGISKPSGTALFVHCQTSLIADFRQTFPDTLTTEGTRAVIFAPGSALPDAPLRLLIRDALTYHRKRG